MDGGFSHSTGCTEARAGWDANYFYTSELIALKERPHDTRACPPLSLRSGWRAADDDVAEPPAACECERSAQLAQWPRLRKDARWQLGVVRCRVPNVTGASMSVLANEWASSQQ